MNVDTGPAVPGQESSTGGAVSAAAQTVQAKAGEGAEIVADNAAEVASTVKEQAGQVVGEAAAQARDLLGEAREQGREQAKAQTRRLAQNVRRLAQELEEMAGHGTPDSTATAAVGQIADRGHRVADHLETRGPEGLLEDVRDFARRRPGLFLTGAALAGFALGRTGKGVAAGSPAGPPASEPRGTDDGQRRPAPVSPSRGGGGSSPMGTAPGPYQAYGESQPPHLTPTYGEDTGTQRQRPPITGS
ncbi:hypothetical protein [Kitasatospora sp. A2-31]|uniref:hypothetical protein n=1 Tax=Kitasatospora sp. A2-31 TaxID=2916414 RepID=UPI001EEC94E3|nr:hypothetical protein [Kitasatospora sp. A2-31]MCG6494314.1 hypothetical protein [Kitasatospora sp. A2-31]